MTNPYTPPLSKGTLAPLSVSLTQTPGTDDLCGEAMLSKLTPAQVARVIEIADYDYGHHASGWVNESIESVELLGLYEDEGMLSVYVESAHMRVDENLYIYADGSFEPEAGYVSGHKWSPSDSFDEYVTECDVAYAEAQADHYMGL